MILNYSLQIKLVINKILITILGEAHLLINQAISQNLLAPKYYRQFLYYLNFIT